MKKKIIFIAEAGVNHNGSIKKALKLVDIAANAGADYVKFQITNSNLISRSAKKAQYQKKNSKKAYESQHDMIKKVELDWDKAHKKIINRCRIKKIGFMTSAFCVDDAKKVKKLKVNIYKIPSGELTNTPLLKYIGSLNRRTILSTGMSTTKEVDVAVKTLIKSGLKIKNLVILQCTSAYPTPIDELNLNTIKFLKDRYKVDVGLSDHSLGILTPIVAVALGASYIEKHFTISKDLVGPDHKASLSPNELNVLIKNIKKIENSFGSYLKKITKSEKSNKLLVRQSIHAKKKIIKGEIFSNNNLMLKRPGNGLQPSMLSLIIGKKSKKNYEEDQIIKSI
jgi:N,N'-diacetyllegionaminate synthase